MQLGVLGYFTGTKEAFSLDETSRSRNCPHEGARGRRKAQCKGFSKNLKEKKVEEVDGGVAAVRRGRELGSWLKQKVAELFEEERLAGSGDSKVVSAAKKEVVDSKKNEVKASPSTATAATGAQTVPVAATANLRRRMAMKKKVRMIRRKLPQQEGFGRRTRGSEATGKQEQQAQEATGNEDATGTATGAATVAQPRPQPVHQQVAQQALPAVPPEVAIKIVVKESRRS